MSIESKCTFCKKIIEEDEFNVSIQQTSASTHIVEIYHKKCWNKKILRRKK